MSGAPKAAEQNPYAPPRSDVSIAAAVTADVAGEITQEEALAFVGKRGDYYWKHWSAAIASGKLTAGYNVGAFFLSLAWALYRRMHREFAIGLGAVIGLGIAENLLLSESAQKTVDRLINFGVAAVWALAANGLYLRRALIAIRNARREEPDPARRLLLLADRGGTRPLEAILGTVILLVAFVAFVLVTTEF